MHRLHEANRKLQWCLEHENTGLEARIDLDDSDRDVYKVSFWKGEIIRRVEVHYSALDCCNPEDGIITDQMRSLLRWVRRECQA